MAELHRVDIAAHLQAILAEYKERHTIYGYPDRKVFRGFPGIDFSVTFHDKIAATPLGPASGPHTQMAQNILLSFLGGGRIMELKTVQILDRLEIPRPCIDVRNVGYNVEWSQELLLDESYGEYVTAWVLLKLLEELEVLGIPKGDPFYNTVFDISVGYDLKGISSAPVHQWLKDICNAERAISQMQDSLPARFRDIKKADINPQIANSATLSTFHGCPSEEIESIVEHLISEHQLHVIVKMNPTILGYDFVQHTLHEDLGYRNIELDRAAFDNDLQFEEGVAMMKRLETFAASRGRKVGAKFTNTLVVKNNEHIFSDEIMYLSGAPLHVLSMNAMHRFRKAIGSHFHISFSAGISKHNFADAVRCNMKPITTCTDLLKTGGYTRLFDYLKNLAGEMSGSGSASLGEFIKNSSGKVFVEDIREAGMINAERIVPALSKEPRYHFIKNRKAPPKMDSHLELFDCISCDKCLPVCPNAANFSIPTLPVKENINRLQFSEGKFLTAGESKFELTKDHQIANLADFCNECGDCDTYCPEHGGPFIEKPRFFGSESTYIQYADYDGFFFPSPNSLVGRIEGVEYQLSANNETGFYTWKSAEVELRLDDSGKVHSANSLQSISENAEISLQAFYIMKVLLDGIMDDPNSYAAVILRPKT